MTIADVKIWGALVGAVVWDEKQNMAAFEYAPAFARKELELSPIMMPTTQRQRVWQFPELRQRRNQTEDTFKGLPGLLADALPDRFGTDLINTWLVRQGRPADDLNPVELLCFIGSRSMGAMEFEPSMIGLPKKQSNKIEIGSIVEVAKSLLQQKTALDTNLGETQKALLDILKVGTSAGGARPKAIIAWNEKTDEVRSGQANAPKGFEHWLIKLDGVSDAQFGNTRGYGRVEMAYYKMAIAAGVEMMPCRLLEENGRAHFMTKRFDRDGNNTKHHVQTWCGLEHKDFNNVTSYSYEQLFQTMRNLRLDYKQSNQMFTRMVFNVLARNCDDHTKNFSFLLKQGQQWELAPAYDICHAYSPKSQWVSQHALSINDKRADILDDDLLAVAKHIGHKKAKAVIEQVRNVVATWPSFADEQKVDPNLRDAIQATIKNRR